MSEEAIECAVAVGAVREEARARSNLGQDLVSLGDVDAGIRELEEARRIGEEHGLIDIQVVASANLSYHLIVADRLDDAVAAATAGAEAARSYGLERRFGPHSRHVRSTRCSAPAVGPRPRRWSGPARNASGAGSARSTGTRRWPGWLGAHGDETAAASRIAEAAALPAGEIDADVGAFVQIVAAELAIEAGHSEAAGEAVLAGLAHLETSDDTVLVGPLVRGRTAGRRGSRRTRPGPAPAGGPGGGGACRGRRA